MALINCNDCGKQVSDKASSCPNCGNPICNKNNNAYKKDDFMKCPKCTSSQLTSSKKGFSGGKAVVGVALTGGIGLLAGTIGRNKQVVTCLRCGHNFKAGEYYSGMNRFREEGIKKAEFNRKIALGEQSYISLILIFFIFSVIGTFITYNLFTSDWTLLGILFCVATIICFLFLVLWIYSEFTRNPSKQKIDKIEPQITDLVRKGEINEATLLYEELMGVPFLQAKEYTNRIRKQEEDKLIELINRGELDKAVNLHQEYTGKTFSESLDYVNILSNKITK